MDAIGAGGWHGLHFRLLVEADPDDGYLSPWFGGRKGGGPRLLGGDGTPVAGIRGRSGADLDAIGLVIPR